jgi:hypothetical protein
LIPLEELISTFYPVIGGSEDAASSAVSEMAFKPEVDLGNSIIAAEVVDMLV